MKSFLLALTFFLLKAPSVFAQSTGQLDLTNITAATQPGNAGGDLANWVQSFYLFSLVGGVFLAVGVIVWAGIRYSLAAGNPSTQSDARDQILQALLGLLLLFGAYLVLSTINPTLTNLAPPTLQSVMAPDVQVAPGGADITLPADVRAEINPGVNVVFTRTISGASELRVLRSDCANQTAGKGVVITKTIPGSSNLAYICELPK